LNAGQTSPRPEKKSLEEAQTFLIKKTIARSDGNARKAAEALGLSRSAIYRRLEKYRL
jgi:DNA-binding NtrC family response regulator